MHDEGLESSFGCLNHESQRPRSRATSSVCGKPPAPVCVWHHPRAVGEEASTLIGSPSRRKA